MLSPGQYNVALDLKEPLCQSWTAVAHEKLALAAGDHAMDQDFSLIKGAVISGNLVDQDTGGPVVGVSVGVYGPAHPKSGGWVQGTTTDQDGVYRLRVPPGFQYVYVSSAIPANLDAAGPTHRDLYVADAQELTVDFPVESPPETKPVSGQVLDADGKPAAGALVGVQLLRRPSLFGPLTSIIADQRGQFQITGAIVYGGADLTATQGPQTTAKAQRVNGGEQLTLRLYRNPNAVIGGFVTDPDGKAIANAEVQLVLSSPWF